VYFSFNFNYIQEADRQAAILDRALNWLGTATSFTGAMAEAKGETSDVPAKLTLGRNFPNHQGPGFSRPRVGRNEQPGHQCLDRRLLCTVRVSTDGANAENDSAEVEASAASFSVERV
jgi:hypothetical protein